MLIPTAVVLATALAIACWRCHTLHRDLTGARVTARLETSTLARDIEALEQALRARAARPALDEAVVAEALAIVRAAAAAPGFPSDLPRGGPDA